MTISFYVHTWVPWAALTTVGFIAADAAFGYLVGLTPNGGSLSWKARYMTAPLIAVAVLGIAGFCKGLDMVFNVLGWQK